MTSRISSGNFTPLQQFTVPSETKPEINVQGPPLTKRNSIDSAIKTDKEASQHIQQTGQDISDLVQGKIDYPEGCEINQGPPPGSEKIEERENTVVEQTLVRGEKTLEKPLLTSKDSFLFEKKPEGSKEKIDGLLRSVGDANKNTGLQNAGQITKKFQELNNDPEAKKLFEKLDHGLQKSITTFIQSSSAHLKELENAKTAFKNQLGETSNKFTTMVNEYTTKNSKSPKFNENLEKLENNRKIAIVELKSKLTSTEENIEKELLGVSKNLQTDVAYVKVDSLLKPIGDIYVGFKQDTIKNAGKIITIHEECNKDLEAKKLLNGLDPKREAAIETFVKIAKPLLKKLETDQSEKTQKFTKIALDLQADTLMKTGGFAKEHGTRALKVLFGRDPISGKTNLFARPDKSAMSELYDNYNGESLATFMKGAHKQEVFEFMGDLQKLAEKGDKKSIQEGYEKVIKNYLTPSGSSVFDTTADKYVNIDENKAKELSKLIRDTMTNLDPNMEPAKMKSTLRDLNVGLLQSAGPESLGRFGFIEVKDLVDEKKW